MNSAHVQIALCGAQELAVNLAAMDGHRVYSTTSGVQLCGDSKELLRLLPDESVDLIVTSPPFALLREKSYGNEDQADYVDWLLAFGAEAHRVFKTSG